MGGLGLKLAAKGADKAGPSFAKFGLSASLAIPILLAIALVGLTVVGILYGIGYIIDMLGKAIAAVFATIPAIIDSVVDGIMKLVQPDVLLGIFGLAFGFMFLASALGMLAMAGWAALPALLSVWAFAAGMAAIGWNADAVITLVHGREGGGKGDEAEETPQWQIDIGNMKTGIENLVKGFGGEPGVKGQYITQFALAIPRDRGTFNLGLGKLK